MAATKPPREIGERLVQDIADAIAVIKAMPGYREPPKPFLLYDWKFKRF